MDIAFLIDAARAFIGRSRGSPSAVIKWPVEGWVGETCKSRSPLMAYRRHFHFSMSRRACRPAFSRRANHTAAPSSTMMERDATKWPSLTLGDLDLECRFKFIRRQIEYRERNLIKRSKWQNGVNNDLWKFLDLIQSSKWQSGVTTSFTDLWWPWLSL